MRTRDERRTWKIVKREERRPCSCPMCGNPRKWTGQPTLAERRAATVAEFDTAASDTERG